VEAAFLLLEACPGDDDDAGSVQRLQAVERVWGLADGLGSSCGLGLRGVG
jgi:hypothetical protein